MQTTTGTSVRRESGKGSAQDDNGGKPGASSFRWKSCVEHLLPISDTYMAVYSKQTNEHKKKTDACVNTPAHLLEGLPLVEAGDDVGEALRRLHGVLHHERSQLCAHTRTHTQR
jgi:hypothetical protein